MGNSRTLGKIDVGNNGSSTDYDLGATKQQRRALVLNEVVCSCF